MNTEPPLVPGEHELLLRDVLELSERLWERVAREMYERGKAEGIEIGRELEGAERDKAWNAMAGPIARGGETHWELARRRAEYATPARTPAEILSRAQASWESLGLPPAGMVHLAGPVVHWHRCKPICYAHKPGYYPPEEAAEILSRLPGDYRETIAELRRTAADQGRGRAA